MQSTQVVFCALKVLATYLPQMVLKLNRVLQDPKREVWQRSRSTSLGGAEHDVVGVSSIAPVSGCS